MDGYPTVEELRRALQGVVRLDGDSARVLDEQRLKQMTDRLAATAAFGDPGARKAAWWLLRAAAADLGVWSASIQPLYVARGRNEWHGLTVPAINARFGYPQLRAIMRTALRLDVGAVTFEIARSEMGYTDTRPAEYAAGVFAAAIREGWRGPLFIQGDHFQVNAKRFAGEPEPELSELESLIDESIAAGFYNIDIDSSTLVDLSQPNIDLQQRPNYEVAVRLATRVREAQPERVAISLGGEIGEVGGKNSTVEELEAYMDGFQRLAAEREIGPGPSKLSVQTGTSHGGTVLPDGTIAAVNVDFEVLRELSRVARERFGMAGAVQHGASTLPDEMFDQFPRIETAEIHLATGYQNVIYDSEAFPAALRDEMYDFLRHEHADAIGDQSDAQFLYKERKRLIGPFKRQLWALGDGAWEQIGADLDRTLTTHFEKLGVAGSRRLIDRYIPRVDVPFGPGPWVD